MPNSSNSPMDTERLKGESQAIRLLIVDDQNFVRQKLQQMLESESDLEIVGTAKDGSSALSGIASMRPDIVLLDLEMPGMDGIMTTQIISERYPECKVLILSGHEEQEYVSKSLQAGAKSYLLKTTPAEELSYAIRFVFRGYSHFSPGLWEKIQTPQSQSDSTSEAEETAKPVLPPAQARDFLPPISKWLTVGGLSIVATIALAIPVASVLKYKTTVKAEAAVRPAGEVRLVQAAIQGQITKIFVKNGQTVKQGDVLATIDNSQLLTKKSQLQSNIEETRSQLMRFDEQIRALDSQIAAENNRSAATVAAAKAELRGNQKDYQDKKTTAITEVNEMQAKLRATQASLSAAQTKQRRYRAAAEEGALSQDQLAEVELEVTQQEQELAATRATLQRAQAALNPNPAEIAIAQQQIDRERNTARASIAALAKEKQGLLEQRIESDKQLQQDRRELRQIETDLTRTSLTSSTAGAIAQFKLRNIGQTVQPGEEVAQILPSNAPLEIKAAVSPQDIGKLEVGQSVQMRVSACLYTDYGTLKGVVRQISQDSIKPEKEGATLAEAKAFYEVTIAPDDFSLGEGKNKCSLQAGMDGRADIVTKEETVLQFLLRKARLISDL